MGKGGSNQDRLLQIPNEGIEYRAFDPALLGTNEKKVEESLSFDWNSKSSSDQHPKRLEQL